jgi:hypothetical protein
MVHSFNILVSGAICFARAPATTITAGDGERVATTGFKLEQVAFL